MEILDKDRLIEGLDREIEKVRLSFVGLSAEVERKKQDDRVLWLTETIDVNDVEEDKLYDCPEEDEETSPRRLEDFRNSLLEFVSKRCLGVHCC